MSLMAADVSSLICLLSDYNNNNNNNNNKSKCTDENNNNNNNGGLVTRDFLGCAQSKELDLELKVPSGWHRRLDLLSGETYLEKSGWNPANREVHDLNLPPPSSNENSAIDLKLLLPSAPRAFDYRSVCTLDKVRSALERAGHESGSKKAQGSCGSASPSTSTTTSSSMKRKSDDQEVEGKRSDGGGLVAAGCPSCLMYVLISKGNPRCPRCDSHVPVMEPAVKKMKKKIDLNLE